MIKKWNIDREQHDFTFHSRMARYYYYKSLSPLKQEYFAIREGQHFSRHE